MTGIIQATGYKTDLDLFDAELKQLLNYDPSCPRVPLLLTRGSIFAPNVPDLAFVGFYEGPFWGVMEAQARVIADTWTKERTTPREPQEKIFESEDAQKMRMALKTDPTNVPQFWMGDYLGLVEELARQTHVDREDSRLGYGKGPVFPARYSSDRMGNESLSVIDEVMDTIEASSKKARFIPAAVFRGLQGVWSVHQRNNVIESTGGIFFGSAQFHPRLPTASQYDAEYLYIEEGNFTMDTGLKIHLKRRYVYRFDKTAEKITSWLVNEDGVNVGAKFNTWSFEAPKSLSSGWLANGYGQCDSHSYWDTCEFRFDGASLKTFEIKHQVRGPSKSYDHLSSYLRPTHH